MYNCHITFDAFERSNRVSIKLSEAASGRRRCDTDRVVFVVACLVNHKESVHLFALIFPFPSQVRAMGMKTSCFETWKHCSVC